MAAYFFMMTGFSILTSFFAIFTEDRFGYNASANGYIFAGIGVIAVIVQGALIGPLVKNFSEKRIAMAGLSILACSMFSLPLARTTTMLLLVGAGIAVGNSFINPTINGLVSRSVNKYWQGRVLGLMQASASLGRFFGPPLGGWLLAFNSRRTPEFGKAPFWTGTCALDRLTGSNDDGARSPTGHAGSSPSGWNLSRGGGFKLYFRAGLSPGAIAIRVRRITAGEGTLSSSHLIPAPAGRRKFNNIVEGC